jgi:hypothetical protein
VMRLIMNSVFVAMSFVMRWALQDTVYGEERKESE